MKLLVSLYGSAGEGITKSLKLNNKRFPNFRLIGFMARKGWPRDGFLGINWSSSKFGILPLTSEALCS